MNDKIYSILIVANYKNSSTSSIKWITMLDSIRHNLLGTEHTPESMWVPFKNMPPIRVSVVDIVESIDDALAYFDTTVVDVVLCEDEINGTRIGIGSLNKMKRKNPDAIYIMMLGWDKKKGVSYPVRDNNGVVVGTEVCDGRKVQSLFDNGYYNAIYKKGFDIHLLVEEIQSGGMSASWAANYYGLSDDRGAHTTTTNNNLREDQDMFGFGRRKKQKVVKDTVHPVQDNSTRQDASMENNHHTNLHDDDYSFENDEVPGTTQGEYIRIENDYEEPATRAEAPYPEELDADVIDDSNELDTDGISYLPAHINSGKTCVRYCMAHVSFIQGDTIILKTDQKLNHGAGYESLIDTDVPVAIPYIVNK